MQEQLNKFECLEVWELVPRLNGVMIITLKWIYKVKLDELGGVLKNKARLVARGCHQEEGIDFEESFAPVAQLEAIRIFIACVAHMNMVVFQMDVKNFVFEMDILRGSLCSQPDDVDHAGCQDTKKRMFGSMQLLGDRLVSCSSKTQKSAAISSTDAEYIALSGCCAQILWMRPQLTDYGLGFNKIPLYCDNILSCPLLYVDNKLSNTPDLKHMNIRLQLLSWRRGETGWLAVFCQKQEYQ
ncbi:retrovirus-related pol polyprotein from transposon TNT 1-94 [Tanacetum coccineum]